MTAVLFSAALLAGGASRRFGSNKALALFHGTPLVERAARTLAFVSDDVFVVANDPAPYEFLGLSVHPDARPGFGPLSGLHAALGAARHDWVFLAACDMPQLSLTLAKTLAGESAGVPAVVPASARGLEPLHALYSKACLPAVEESIRTGAIGMQELLLRLGARVLPYVAVRALTAGADPFENVNTPSDYDRLKR